MTIAVSDVDSAEVQGSSAWLRFRQGKIGASDSPIIMGVSPWQTPHGLWRDKKGLNFNPNAVKGKSMNWAIEKGLRWEPMARARYEIINDIPMEPAVLTHPEHEFLIASLDGWNAQARRVLEIKIPGKEVFEAAKAGVVHEKYVYQLEHQMLVSQADDVHFYCCKVETKDGKEKITDSALVVYKSNPDLRDKLIPKLHEFWGYMQRNEPPQLTDRDTLVLEAMPAKILFEKIGILEMQMDQVSGEIDVLERDKENNKPEIKDKQKKFDLIQSEQYQLKKKAGEFLTHPRVRAGWVELRQHKRFKDTWLVKLHPDEEKGEE